MILDKIHDKFKDNWLDSSFRTFHLKRVNDTLSLWPPLGIVHYLEHQGRHYDPTILLLESELEGKKVVCKFLMEIRKS